MSKVKSIADRTSDDNTTWSLEDMLQHALIEHKDEEIKHALLLLEFNDGSGHYYAVRATRKDMLWVTKAFKHFLMSGDDQ